MRTLKGLNEMIRNGFILRWVEALGQDIRYGLRALTRNPGLILVAVLSLALGIGANLTIYGLIREVLLRPATANQPDRLLQIEGQMSYLNYRDLDESRIFSRLAAYTISDESWIRGDAAESVRSYIVSANFFALLGVQSAMGRTFTSEESAPEHNPQSVVLSHRFWQRRLGGDPSVIGQDLNLNGRQFTVLGILPADYRSLAYFGEDPELYLPLSSQLVSHLNDRASPWFFVVGRLDATATQQQAEAALTAVAQRLEEIYPDENKGFGRARKTIPLAGLGSLKRYGPEEWIFSSFLLVVVGLVLLIACANVSSLLLARSADRRREIALRLALGASRGRLVQQLLTESLLLAVLATGAGLLLYLWLTEPLKHVGTPLFDTTGLQLALDSGLLLLGALLALAATLICGLVPALQSTRPQLLPALKEEVVEFARRRLSFRNLLVTGQVTASVVLLVSGSLFLRSLFQISTVSPGFDVDHTLTTTVNLVRDRYTAAQERLFFEQVVERVEAFPGVQSASVAAILPVSFSSTGTWMWIAGRENEPRLTCNLNIVGPRYFETLGIPLLRGREFQRADREGAPRVAVVNETFARRYFPNDNPVGKRLVLGEGKDILLDVVGLARDSKYLSLGEKPVPLVYLSSLQPQQFRRVRALLVRTAGPPDGIVAPLKRVIIELDRLAGVETKTMRDHLALALFPTRAGAILLGSLGVLGLLLAVVGLYGVMAYAVSRRTKEIGIRMALGASRTRVLKMVLRDGLLLVGVGGAIGLAISLVVTQPLETYLAAEVGATDPFSFFSVLLVLALVGTAACLLPAHRAMKVDPMAALRYE